MKIDSQEALSKLIDVMRSKGVAVFEVDGIKVEFGPLDSKAPAESKAIPDPELCACKCPNYAHTNGYCINGCAPEKCAGPEETPDA